MSAHWFDLPSPPEAEEQSQPVAAAVCVASQQAAISCFDKGIVAECTLQLKTQPANRKSLPADFPLFCETEGPKHNLMYPNPELATLHSCSCTEASVAGVAHPSRRQARVTSSKTKVRPSRVLLT